MDTVNKKTVQMLNVFLSECRWHFGFSGMQILAVTCILAAQLNVHVHKHVI